MTEVYQDNLENIESPAFIYDEARLQEVVQSVRCLVHEAGANLLFSLKAFAIPDALSLMTEWIDGFAASAAFEARLARDVLGPRGTVHITTPGFRSDELSLLGSLCDYISFNSVSQLVRLGARLPPEVNVGLRVNPQLSLVDDKRYDPCRPHSKLGVELSSINHSDFRNVSGVLFHTHCEATSFEPLLATVRHIGAVRPQVLEDSRWINLGGGYLFNACTDSGPFLEAVEYLRSGYGLTVFVEPGAGLIRDAVTLLATVIDLTTSGGKSIAVLDASVNHMPEVFEFQFEPDVLGHREGAPYDYILAGATCLAGDFFGEYSFEQPLEIGSRVLFPNAGAYTLVKANMFNGLNLPAIYALDSSGSLKLKRRFGYKDFLARCGGGSLVTA